MNTRELLDVMTWERFEALLALELSKAEAALIELEDAQ